MLDFFFKIVFIQIGNQSSVIELKKGSWSNSEYF